MTFSAILLTGTILSTTIFGETLAQRKCDGRLISMIINGERVDYCIPEYLIIDRTFVPPECLCPIVIHINPKIIEELGLNESLIAIDQGQQFDTVTLKIPKSPNIQNTSIGLK